MSYSELVDFIQNRMSMQHIYQPLMLLTLLEHNGRCHERDIALAILQRDESQIDYYTSITRNMVGRVLRNHHILEKDDAEFALVGFPALSPEQIRELVSLCKAKLTEYIEKRGASIWAHRDRSARYISGTLKFEVLKRARFRCELCGISADECALEVDHIIPRNKGGTDDISNLQALCYRDNARKRDRDNTDFRAIRDSYALRQKGCVFCENKPSRVIADNELAFVIRDGFPVADLHSLVIPKRHVATYFELGQAEINACSQLLNATKAKLLSKDTSIAGFNVGINDGEVAGQTVMHCHIHLIPRRKGDVENPEGGVRHIIPGKGSY